MFNLLKIEIAPFTRKAHTQGDSIRKAQAGLVDREQQAHRDRMTGISDFLVGVAPTLETKVKARKQAIDEAVADEWGGRLYVFIPNGGNLTAEEIKGTPGFRGTIRAEAKRLGVGVDVGPNIQIDDLNGVGRSLIVSYRQKYSKKGRYFDE